MKISMTLAACGVALLAASAASAEPWVDYTPVKGAMHATTMQVDPNHVDDYLVGLKKTWLPGEEIAKKKGLIDFYAIQVKLGGDGHSGNVLLLEHIPDLALLEPNKERDQAMEKEVFDAMPKDKMDAQVKDFDKYRTFVSDDYWTGVEFSK